MTSPSNSHGHLAEESTSNLSSLMALSKNESLRSSNLGAYHQNHSISSTTSTVATSFSTASNNSLTFCSTGSLPALSPGSFRLASPSKTNKKQQQMHQNNTSAASALVAAAAIRFHDDQEDEAYYDDRSDADDDLAKGTIKFPKDKLFGRDEELDILEATANSLLLHDGEETTTTTSNTIGATTNKVLWMCGPSGVGKSSLIEEALRRLELRRQDFLFSRGKYDQGAITREPFSAINQALSMMLIPPRSTTSMQNDSEPAAPADGGQSDSSSSPLSTTISLPQHLQIKLKEDAGDADHDTDLESGFWNSPEAQILLDVFPILKKFYRRYIRQRASSSSSSASSSASSLVSSSADAPPTFSDSSTATNDLSQVGRALASFFGVLSHRRRPLILYLDDLQWADVASLEMLEALMLEQETLQHFLLIGSYRSEELESQPRLGQLVQTSQEKRPADQTILMNISTLAPRHVSEFLKETLDLPSDEIQPLSELIYSKTLGNVFYCKQAVEELVRHNALYYDVMCFKWTFSPMAADNLTSADKKKSADGGNKEDFMLSKSVVEMIQHKLELLPEEQRRVLVVASYIRYILDVPSLLACLAFVQNDQRYSAILRPQLLRILDDSVDQGLLLKKKTQDNSSYYVFAHDRVQEAAYTLIPPGEQRHQLLVQTSKALLLATGNCKDDMHDHESNKNEWMLYVAAEHMNQVPTEYVSDPVQLAELNLRVANMSMAKASYDQAVRLLRAGVAAIYALPGAERIDRPTLERHRRGQWEKHYDLLLALTNHSMEAEEAQGNFTECKAAVEECLANAKSHNDKCTAYFTKVNLAVGRSEQKRFGDGILESVEILAGMGISIPSKPTKADLLGEKLRLQLALGSRSISAVADLPLAEEDWKVKLLCQLGLLANYCQNMDLTALTTLRALRLALQEGATQYLPRLLTSYAVSLRKKGQLSVASSYAAVVNRLYARFPDARGGGEYAKGQTILYCGVVHLQESFHESLDVVLSLYRMNLAGGNVDMGLSSAMHFPLLYLASGLPLNSLLDPKLILFQNKSRQLNRPGFEAIFKGYRQFLRNLQGKSSFAATTTNPNGTAFDPTRLKGDIMDEKEILTKMEGNSFKMTLRDFGILRLGLACIFGDYDAMIKMMDRLKEFPLFDLSLVREHLRLTFHGLAAFLVGRKQKNKQWLSVGKEILQSVKKLLQSSSSSGSRNINGNVRPLYQCLRAVECGKKGFFDEAIASCSAQNLLHLEALMQEQCGRMLLDTASSTAPARNSTAATDSSSSLSSSPSSSPPYQTYLSNSTWLYNDWGAYAKVEQLKKEFPFLSKTPRGGRGLTGGGAIRELEGGGGFSASPLQ
jgi:predicted ATPase